MSENTDRTFYVTTPIYYVNDAPHIGHAYTTVLADVLARYHRLFGESVFFLTGTDEHGQKVQQAAEKMGHSPKEHCDLYSQRFREAWQGLGIGYDHFIRTTDPEHIAFVRRKLKYLWDNDQVYAKEYAGWYSTGEERFFTEKELVDGKDPISGRPVEWITEKNYFFKMSNYQDKLLKHIEENPEFIVPDFRRNEVLGFLRQPLNDLCISRPKARLSWGISLPFDEDYVAYVWVDALLNYASAVEGKTFGNGQKIWPADCHLIGKDILTTHAVYWPTLLLALGMELPLHIVAHGWWLVDNARMSKTTGNVVSPLAMKDKYGVDAFRYFLIREMVVGQDANFSEKGFINSYNAFLANEIGNALSRVLKLAQTLNAPLTGRSNYQPMTFFRGLEEDVNSSLDVAKMQEALMNCNPYLIALRANNVFIAINRFLENTAPWKLAKAGENEQLSDVLWHATEALRIGFTMLHPIMPGKMKTALAALGLEPEPGWPQWRRGNITFNLPTSLPPPLFPRIETKLSAPERNNMSAPEDPFEAIELRVVKILGVEDHPNAESLYVLQIDAGDGTRTVCAGLRKHIPRENLVGQTAVLVANLKPAPLRGIVSQGMLLAAAGEAGALSLVRPEKAKPGDRVRARGLEAPPKSQITLKDFEKCKLTVQEGQVHYGKLRLQTASGPVTAQVSDGSEVR